MSETRRVLVTGGAGFVGATLVRRLVGSGHTVRVLDNYSTGDASYLAGVDAELIEGDIRDAAAPPVSELSLPKPISPYGASKLAGEGYAHAFAKSYGLRTVALRFANVYGPWSAHKPGAMTVFFRAIHEGEPIVIYGDGSSSRDYTHVDDIARALRLALEGDVPPGTVLQLASGVETTVAELADLCRAASGALDHPVEYRPGRPGEVGRNFASYDLAQKMLGYAPTIGREDGTATTWQWYAEAVFAPAGS